MNKKQLAHLLKKYQDGDCTDTEKAIVNEWYDTYDELDDHLSAEDHEYARQIKQRIFTGILKETQKKPAVIQPLWSNWWIRITVAAVILFFIKVAVQDLYPASPVEKIAQDKDIHVTNNTNVLLKQVLPDHSVVWLNPKSTLSFPETFKGNSRNVKMSGICFFEVTKNPARPFIIESANVVTKVWGTSFKVDDSNLKEATVTVLTGKVSVSKKTGAATDKAPVIGEDEVLLLPNQRVTYQQKTNTLSTSKGIEMSSMELYKHFNLSFENEKLSNIVLALSKAYKSTIEIDPSVDGNKIMNADFTGLNLPEVLETLETSLKVTYEINSKTIILTK